MGIVKLEPNASFIEKTSGQDRGQFQQQKWFTNRLGREVLVVCRNGINAVLPPDRRYTADGCLHITAEYRCLGKSALNQHINFARNNKNVANFDKFGENSDCLRILYKIPIADIYESGSIMYMEELDLYLSLDTEKPVPDHLSPVDLSTIVEGLASTGHVGLKVGINEDCEYAMVAMGNHFLTLPVIKCRSGPILFRYECKNGEYQESHEVLSRHCVLPLTDKANVELFKRINTIASDRASQYEHEVLTGQSEVLDLAANKWSHMTKDLSKSVTEGVAALDKAEDQVRNSEIADLKHAQAKSTEGVKTLSTVLNLGAKLVDLAL